MCRCVESKYNYKPETQIRCTLSTPSLPLLSSHSWLKVRRIAFGNQNQLISQSSSFPCSPWTLSILSLPLAKFSQQLKQPLHIVTHGHHTALLLHNHFTLVELLIWVDQCGLVDAPWCTLKKELQFLFLVMCFIGNKTITQAWIFRWRVIVLEGFQIRNNWMKLSLEHIFFISLLCLQGACCFPKCKHSIKCICMGQSFPKCTHISLSSLKKYINPNSWLESGVYTFLALFVHTQQW